MLRGSASNIQTCQLPVVAYPRFGSASVQPKTSKTYGNRPVLSFIAPGTPLPNKTGHHSAGGREGAVHGRFCQRGGWSLHADFAIADDDLVDEESKRSEEHTSELQSRE